MLFVRPRLEGPNKTGWMIVTSTPLCATSSRTLLKKCCHSGFAGRIGCDFGSPRKPARLEIPTRWPERRSSICGTTAWIELTGSHQIYIDQFPNRAGSYVRVPSIVAADARAFAIIYVDMAEL